MEDSLYPMRRLCDVGVTLLDCEHRTPAAAPVGYPYVAIPNIRDGQLDLTGVRRISKEDFDLWTRKTKPKAGDIIMTRRARIGDIAVVPDGLECAIGQNLVILRSNGQQIDQSYLRWALRDVESLRYSKRGRLLLSMCSEIWHGFVRRDSPEKPCRTYGQVLSTTTLLVS